MDVGWNTFTLKVLAASGESVDYNEDLLHSSHNESLRAEVEPGQEIRRRFFFEVLTDDRAAALHVQEGSPDDGYRRFVSDLSFVK